MDINYSAIGHIAGATAYLLIAILIFFRYRRRIIDRALIAACLITSLWLTTIALQSTISFTSFHLRYALEILRNAAWFSIITLLMGTKFFPKKNLGIIKYRLICFVQILLISGLLFILVESFTHYRFLSDRILLSSQVAISLIGLILLEQVWKNTNPHNRTSLKYLIIALAFIFGYDFYMYSNALLYQRINPDLWAARGFINLIVAPLIAINLINGRRQPVDIKISRQIIFHTSTLILGGSYLIIISLGGYYLQLSGKSWGNIIEILFLFVSALGMVILISSPKWRANLMIFISKNFFNYKYDYREEWLKSTKTITNTSSMFSLSERAIISLSEPLECHSGALWYLNDTGDFEVNALYQLPYSKIPEINIKEDIVNFFKSKNWIIDLHDYSEDPTRYQLLEIPDAILNLPNPWLVIPLFLSKELKGLVVICNPITNLDLNWENYDLLKIIAIQGCAYLEQSLSQNKLAEAQQFEAVNKTSAFIIHDLKTVVAQLSLMVNNAEEHKQNPNFIDDMIRTTGHTVDKITYLLQQLKKPQVNDHPTLVDLTKTVEELKSIYADTTPLPTFNCSEKKISAKVNKSQLNSIIGHIIQNAIDATPKNGDISIVLRKLNNFAIFFIQDSGSGMSADFIKNELFKPFVSTKGVSGMGIGAYQCREYIKKIGGSIDVTSEKGDGTCFTIKIPTSN